MKTRFSRMIGSFIAASAFCLTSLSTMAAVVEAPAWDATAESYAKDSKVCHTLKLYKAKWYVNKGVEPGVDQWGPWNDENTACKVGTTPGGPTDPVNPGKPYLGADGKYHMTEQMIAAGELKWTDNDKFRQIKASIVTLPNAEVEQVAPNRAANPENVKRVERIMSTEIFDDLFSMRALEYSYTKFLKATAKFPAFCGTYTDGRNSDEICKKSLITMFAHFGQETGGHDKNAPIPEWKQALVHVREMGCVEGGSGCGYNNECKPGTWQSEAWPCGTNADGTYKQYFGRGAKQLSYNYNYGPFSQAIYGTVRTLLDNPSKVADEWLNLASAVFFFVYPQPPKPSMLHVIDGTWVPNANDIAANRTPGFGATIMIINGGIECGHGYDKPQALNRIKYYKAISQYFNVAIPADEKLDCKDMKPFDTGSSGAMLVNWDQDWGYYADNPEGKSFACKPVAYQTRHNALYEGDYKRCVVHYFDVVVDPNPVP